MKRREVVKAIVGERGSNSSRYGKFFSAFAPSNIALCKYWGKKDEELNVPMTSSLSISLGGLGSFSEVKLLEGSGGDVIFFNEEKVDERSEFFERLSSFLDLFRREKDRFCVRSFNNVPTSAGLASSASGFASIVLALDRLFCWELNVKELSILARLGSGSACRSVLEGFVVWERGEREDGMDSFAYSLEDRWQQLVVGIVVVDKRKKQISSRSAMKETVERSRFYSLWPEIVAEDLCKLKESISARDFCTFGQVLESNALAMHATMLTSTPSICYFLPSTMEVIHKVWKQREGGVQIFFTEDAGPNVKLLFLSKDVEKVRKAFPSMVEVSPFNDGFVSYEVFRRRFL